MKEKKGLWLVALLLTVWLFCLPLTVHAASRPIDSRILDTAGSVTIHVIQYMQSQVVSGATVSTTVDGKTVQLKTGADGKATFAKLPPGSYSFTIMKASYLAGTANVTVRSGSVTDYNVYVCEVASYNYPKYSLGGKIQFRDNDYTTPYTRAGVKVTLRYSPASFGPEVPSWLSKSNVYTAVTDTNGFYKIEGIISGIYQFSVSYPGYTGLYYPLGTNAWYSDYNPPGFYLGFFNRYSNAYTLSGYMSK